IRRCGSAALDLAYTAAGVYDGFFEFRLSPWDIGAGVLLIREAGGVVSDLDGGEGLFESGNVVAGNPAVHRALLAAGLRPPRPRQGAGARPSQPGGPPGVKPGKERAPEPPGPPGEPWRVEIQLHPADIRRRVRYLTLARPQAVVLLTLAGLYALGVLLALALA